MAENRPIPNYQLIINPKLKYTHLLINEQGELIVKSPTKSRYHIEYLLHKKQKWIESAKERFMQKKGRIPSFKNRNETLYFLGTPYPLQLKKISSEQTMDLIDFEYKNQESFILSYKEINPIEFQKAIENFYKKKSKKIITPLVEQQAELMSLYPTAINFRKTKRQWGSCSSKNRLSFNTGLIKLPLDVIQYVIIHELAHIKHKHHQKAFWKEVEQYSPEYKKLENKLKEYLT